MFSEENDALNFLDTCEKGIAILKYDDQNQRLTSQN
jgi:hypothetical protein